MKIFFYAFSGSVSSINKAAKMYGVPSRTLHNFITTNTSYVGAGKKSVYLSREEEEAIVDK